MDDNAKSTEWVLVETVSQFVMQYMIEVPKGNEEWALDVVTCEEAKEFSQKHIGETIISHRILTQEDALGLCDKMNAYSTNWTNDNKVKSFFTKLSEYKNEPSPEVE